MSGKAGLHKRGNCECSADGSYQDERCAWFEEGHEEGLAALRAELDAARKLVAELADHMAVMLEDLEGTTQGDVDHIDKYGTRKKAVALLSRARDCGVGDG